VQANVRPNVKTEDVEAAIYAEIERLKTEPIADWELEKAKNSARAAFINSVDTSLNRANLLTGYALLYNDPGLINTLPDKIAAVTKEDVRRVAGKYLNQTNRTVVVTTPKARAAAPAAAGR
jgi:predicted Zn-dependent peptidase